VKRGGSGLLIRGHKGGKGKTERGGREGVRTDLVRDKKRGIHHGRTTSEDALLKKKNAEKRSRERAEKKT